jgi:hypothetical protein
MVLRSEPNTEILITYGNTIEHGDRYWQRTSPTPAEKYTEHPARASMGSRTSAT